MAEPACLTDAGRRGATPREREREQARDIVTARGHLHEAMRGLALKGGNADIFEEIIRADEELIRGLIILLGINPENEGDPGAMDRWDSRTRAEQLEGEGGAWFYVRRVGGFIRTALSRAWTRKRAAGGIAHLQNAKSLLDGLDQTLWQERPADAPTIGRPGIGHGSVNMLAKRVNQSTVYDRRWLLGTEEKNRVPPWLPTYRAGVTQELRDQLGQYIVIQAAKAQAIGLFCGIYDEPPDPQCRVHEAFRLLWVEAAKGYRAIFGDPLSDGWLTGIDLGGWAGFYLPKCGGRP